MFCIEAGSAASHGLRAKSINSHQLGKSTPGDSAVWLMVMSLLRGMFFRAATHLPISPNVRLRRTSMRSSRSRRTCWRSC